MLYGTPAAVSAAATATRDGAGAGMIGRRTSGWNQSWMRDSAYLSGAGEASENIALCSGNSRSCSARARGQSFAAQAAAKSAHSRGATLAVTEMQPAPPDRKSVVEGKSVSVRVDLGGGRIIKKKNKSITN